MFLHSQNRQHWNKCSNFLTNTIYPYHYTHWTVMWLKKLEMNFMNEFNLSLN